MSGPPEFDLDPTSRGALELDAVLAHLSTLASTTTGRSRLLSTQPTADLSALVAGHAAVAEAREHVGRHGRLLPTRIPDPQPALAALEVDGLPAEPLALRDLALALVEAGEARKRLSSLEGAGYEALKAIGRSIPDLGALAREVALHVAPDGSLEDNASPELERLRSAIGKTSERLRRQLEALVGDPAAASVVRDDFVTQRNGRFVIPVRADSPRPVEGIVHAASSSGQTLFVEPIASVALNNELVRLAEQDAVERERIVRGWTERYRGRRDEISQAIEGLTRVDVLQAKALFAQECEGCRPELAARGPLRLSAVRHPLLDRRLREHGARSVPIDVEIDPFDRVLVMSGPNTGGKTVALKTVGLACLMAQCGLPVAAAEAVLPVFRQLRADIGDHQSIDADLSTFSGHVRAVSEFLDDADPPALFLFDEIGTGTEPGEGAALARAVLERLLDRRVTAIATTHHAALKAWAFADTRVASAAMEFDQETFRPTYRVLAGAAGASVGIEVAGKLGLDPALVARARELHGTGGDAEASMARLRDLLTANEERAAALARREEALEVRATALEAQFKLDTTRQREQASRQLASALDEFRRDARRELASIKDAKERAKVEKMHAKAESRLNASARARQESIVPSERQQPARPAVIAPGVKVRILSLEREGEIVAIRGERVDVRMGTATFTVARSDVASAGGIETIATPRTKQGSRRAALASASRAAGFDETSDATPLELHLIGKTVDEALPALDRFLDVSQREGRKEVRVVHGHGTGRLRLAVRRHLTGHPQVEAFRAGGDGEGGDGATVVTIA